MKHLVDLDETSLADARTQLGTSTIEDTVNAALRMAAGRDPAGQDVADALDTLAAAALTDRADTWR